LTEGDVQGKSTSYGARGDSKTKIPGMNGDGGRVIRAEGLIRKAVGQELKQKTTKHQEGAFNEARKSIRKRVQNKRALKKAVTAENAVKAAAINQKIGTGEKPPFRGKPWEGKGGWGHEFPKGPRASKPPAGCRQDYGMVCSQTGEKNATPSIQPTTTQRGKSKGKR